MDKSSGTRQALVETLRAIEQNDTNYAQRTKLVYAAMHYASELDYFCGVRYDASEGTEWPVFCIILPGVGEVAWHCKGHLFPFTNYTTEEKYKRIAEFGGNIEEK